MNTSKSFLQILSSVWGFRFFLKSKSWLAYALKLILLLAIPYCWILIFGFVDTLVNAYTFMLYFTFIGAIVLLAFNLFLIACATIIMCNPKKYSKAYVPSPEKTVVKPTQKPKAQKEKKVKRTKILIETEVKSEREESSEQIENSVSKN